MNKRDLTLDGLVHDLNNVFQTVLEAADLVAGDPKWAPTVSLIFRAVDQGKRIVASIVETERATADLEVVLEHAAQFAQDFAQTVQGSTLQVSLHVDRGLEPSTPPAALERVFVNLFINAARAATEGGREDSRIEVSASVLNGEIVVRVADNGPGVAPELLPIIFAPRVSSSAVRSGLGLHIVDTIVRAHGGSVSARNRDQGGAEFLVTLPVAVRAEMADANI